MNAHELVKNLALLALVSLICVVLLEAAVRVVYPQPSVMFIPDQYTGYKHAPDSDFRFVSKEFDVTLPSNDDGLIAEKNYVKPKPAGVYRVLVLGDSFVEAGQVPLNESFVKQLEAKLNARNDGRTYEVLNAGNSGYGTKQEYLYLKHYGAQYQPDMVVLVMFEDNDIRNNYFDFGPNQVVVSLENDSLAFNFSLVQQKQSLKFFIGKHSQLAYILYYRVWPHIQGTAYDQTACPNDFFVYNKTTDKDWQQAFAITDKLLLETSKTARDLNASFVLVQMPRNIQIQPEEAQKLAEQYECMRDVDLDKPHRFVSAACGEYGLSCIDLRPVFREAYATDKEPLHYALDGHLNSHGHDVTAQTLFNTVNATLP